MAQQVRLGEGGEHSEVVEGGPEAAAGQGEPYLADEDGLDRVVPLHGIGEQATDDRAEPVHGQPCQRAKPRQLSCCCRSLPWICVLTGAQ